MADKKSTGPATYTPEFGETLRDIALKHGLEEREIRLINGWGHDQQPRGEEPLSLGYVADPEKPLVVDPKDLTGASLLAVQHELVEAGMGSGEIVTGSPNAGTDKAYRFWKQAIGYTDEDVDSGPDVLSLRELGARRGRFAVLG